MMKKFNEEEHLDICQNIEFGLKQAYETHELLTDTLCMTALESAKIAIKQEFGYAKNEKIRATDQTQGIIDWCVSVGLDRIDKSNGLTLKGYIQLIEKIKKSVTRHANFGRRGYYEFIKNYV